MESMRRWQFADRLVQVWRTKSWSYWLIAFVILGVTIRYTPEVNDYLRLTPLRYRLFEAMGVHSARPLRAQFTKVVAVDDADYLYDEPQGSSPINRHYLARIVTALADDDVALIALDFNLHFKDRTVVPKIGDYSKVANKNQVDALVRAIAAAAARNIKIVLPKNIGGTGPYWLDPDIYQPYGICTQPIKDGVWASPGAPGFPLTPAQQANITCGYIQLPVDMRQVPPLLDVGLPSRIDSLSLAIARAKDRQEAEAVGNETKTRFVIYLPPAETKPFTARSLLRSDKDVLAALRHELVLVGGMWHTDPATLIDTHDAVTGPTSGVLIHQNFAEGILDVRLVKPIPEWLLLSLEILFGVAVALLFAAFSQLWAKVLLLVGIALLLFVSQWLLFALSGDFLEAFPPLLGLALHSILEKLRE